jgi:arylsulfatase A-like enzyme
MECLRLQKLRPIALTDMLATFLAVLCLAGCAASTNGEYPAAMAPDRSLPKPPPNIVLIVFEDMSPRIGAFGDPVATTPELDAFAQEAVRYPNTFTTSGVCAPSRSALITGVHQQTLGTHQMRTKSPVPGMKGGGPIEYEAVPPPQVKAFPELLRRAGYYTSNNGKTDYQFGEPFTVWDANAPDADWSGRAEGQPFFAMFNILETHESYIWPEDRESANPLLNAVTMRNRRDLAGKERVTDPAEVEVPPYLPDTPVVRDDLARHYDNIAFAEKKVGEIMERLKTEGLLDDTIVIVTTDHGDGFPRMKRTVYDSGLLVPMMVRFPDERGAGTVQDRLVSFIDLAPTILDLAGAQIPDWIQGLNFIDGSERDYVFAAADRHDAVPGRTKAVRDGRYKYIRNYLPELAVLRPLAFRDALPTMQEIWRLAKEGTLPGPAARLIDSPRGREELYDTTADPHEIDNLVDDPAHADTLARMRGAMDAWIARTGDMSAIPEAEMVEAMWPGLVQPVTATPEIRISDGRVVLSSATPGASIAYTLDGSEPLPGKIYSSPFAPAPGAIIAARAVRYGYAASEVSTRSVP